jgi:DNA repair exonuclease SbcCD nuclease subunit
LGDFHEFQVLKTKKCIALYGGSIEKSDFSEIDQKKGFIFYDSEAKEEGAIGKCRFIENPNCRPMLELKGNFSDIKKQFAQQDISKLQDSMVKISFKGSGDELLSFSSGLDSFKKELREKLNPIHIVTTQKVKNEVIEAEASKLEQEIMDKGHLDMEDIMPIVNEALVERVENKQEAQAIMDLGLEIYNEITKG